MSIAILERARAFDMIAQHLPETRRTEIAEAIADRILSEITPARRAGTARPEPQPTLDVDLSPHTEVASFLVDKGLKGLELMRACDALVAWLAEDEFASLPRTSRMQTWWASKRERGA